MQIATSSASALAAGQAIASYPADQQDEALFLLVVLAGILLAVFGLLNLGCLVRYVFYAVMTGFLIGVAVVLILDQLAPLVGYSPEGVNEVVQFVDLLRNVDEFDVRAIIIGVSALGIMVVLARTRLADLSNLFALVVPTVLVLLLGWEGVEQVTDVSPIPRGFPDLTLPDLALISPSLLLAAFSLAAVIAVQGAGNVAAGLFSGIPAGGSVGQTALNVSVGARSCWAGVFHGLRMLAIVLLLSGLVGLVPMTLLAALMIVAGAGAIDFREARSIWRTGGGARWVLMVTFVSTLVLSIPTAAAVGVALTIVVFMVSSASNVSVRALEFRGNGEIVETDVPERLPSRSVTVLGVYGSLFFAAARTLQGALPSPEGTARPVVVLRLRENNQVGATLIDVLDEYAHELADAGGHFYLSGMDKAVSVRLRRADKLRLDEEVYIYLATNVLGGSARDAIEAANAWLRRTRDDSPLEDDAAP